MIEPDLVADSVMDLPRDARSHDELAARFRWRVPARYNIARDVCGRHAADPGRVALFFEDESGAASTHTYAQVQAAANRLCNALFALGVERGDRVAIVLPQRPETAIAHVACYQMGAIALPLSHLFGADALEFRLADAGAKVAIADPDTLPKLFAVRERLPQLDHLIGVAGAREARVADWDDLLGRAADTWRCIDTRADDPALIIYTSGTTGPPKGALLAHRTLIGNLPGFACSHDFFPEDGDRFWSPADWAWTGGLFDALLPTWHYGMPLVGYRGRFDPERACVLMQKHGVRNAFLFPTALKMIMKEVGDPRGRFDLRLRSLMSGGEAVGETLSAWACESLGVTINEIFGQTEMNYVVGGCARVFEPRPGAMGRPYPGHRIALLDDDGNELPDGVPGEIAVHREGDPVVFLGYWNNPEATEAKFTGPWGRTGDVAVRDAEGYYWYHGRTDDVIKSAGYRIGPAEVENCLVRHPAVANAAVIGVPDAERGSLVKAVVVLTAGHAPSAGLEAELQAHVRARLAPYQVPRLFEFTAALPMTTTGKVQRRVLREAGGAG
jgi:acetyl-CoA synthetase